MYWMFFVYKTELILDKENFIKAVIIINIVKYLCKKIVKNKHNFSSNSFFL